MAREQFFSEPVDIQWLFSSHLQPFDNLREKTVCAILEGNEDAPDKVTLYAENDYRAKPLAVFIQSDLSGNMVLDETI